MLDAMHGGDELAALARRLQRAGFSRLTPSSLQISRMRSTIVERVALVQVVIPECAVETSSCDTVSLGALIWMPPICCPSVNSLARAASSARCTYLPVTQSR